MVGRKVIRNSADCPGRRSHCSGKTKNGLRSAAAARFASASKLVSFGSDGSCPPQNTVSFCLQSFVTVTVRDCGVLNRLVGPKSICDLSRDTATSGSGSNIAMKVSCAVIAEALTASISLGNNERSLRLGGWPGVTRPVAHKALYSSTCDTRIGAGLRLSS